MRVLIISPRFPPHGGGAEVSTFLQCKLLSDEGVDVSIVTKQYPNEKRFERISKRAKVIRIPLRDMSETPLGEYITPEFSGSTLQLIRKICMKEQPDIIHIEQHTVGIEKLGGVANLPFIFTVRDHWPICYINGLWNGNQICDGCNIGKMWCKFNTARASVSNYPSLKNIGRLIHNFMLIPANMSLMWRHLQLRRNFLMNMDKIIAISLFVQNSLANYGGMNKSKLSLIYPNLPESDYISREIEETFTITFMGKLEPWKGVMNLLKAFKKVTEKRRNVKLLIVGNGSQEKQLKRFVLREKLQGIVSFEGWVPHSSLPLIIKKTDIVVMPSLWLEPFGRTAVEAMAFGRPVIVNPVGGLNEQVKDNLNGFYANCYDVDALANKIFEVAEMPHETLIEIGKRSREYVLKKFDNAKSTKNLIEIYNSLN